MRRIFLATIASGLVILAAAKVPLANATGADAKVAIDNFTFSPAEIDIAPGTKITWTNNDDIPHTVTDADPVKKFKSAALDTGEQFSFTFDQPGTYHYFCSLHAHMQGTIIVK